MNNHQRDLQSWRWRKADDLGWCWPLPIESHIARVLVTPSSFSGHESGCYQAGSGVKAGRTLLPLDQVKMSVVALSANFNMWYEEQGLVMRQQSWGKKTSTMTWLLEWGSLANFYFHPSPFFSLTQLKDPSSYQMTCPSLLLEPPKLDRTSSCLPSLTWGSPLQWNLP